MKNDTETGLPSEHSPESAAEFEALLRAGMDDLLTKTSAHQDKWSFGGEEQWFFDHGSAEVIFTFSDSVVSAPAQIIGTWDKVTKVWTWAWADSELAEHLKVDALRLKEYGHQHGLQHLLTASWPAEESHCWYMTALACWLCQAKGGYRGLEEGSCTFITFGEPTITPLQHPRHANTAGEPEVEAVETPETVAEEGPELDYSLEEFLEQAREEFEDCGDDVEAQRQACCRYLKRGVAAGIGESDLIHHLGLSTPSLLEKAGYSPEAAVEVMDLLRTISDEEIQDCSA